MKPHQSKGVKTKMPTQAAYQVLLYYLYAPVADPEQLQADQYEFCVAHKLLGRIIVSKEGINGTVSGSVEACAAYMAYLKSDARFEKIEFKIDSHNEHAFQKLHVRVKPEIVHVGLPNLNPNQWGGTKIDAKTFQTLKEQPNVVLLDVRSNYEHKLGKFKGSKTLDIDHFRYFPEAVKPFIEARKKDGKAVITICTGNIKCEKASSYLKQNGLNAVYQLDGGIIKYGHTSDGRDFDGKCYVFDNRLSVSINRHNPTTIAACFHCSLPCERMVNCANPSCNSHIPLCSTCGKKLAGACSKRCQKDPRKRAYNGRGYYTKNLEGYNPILGLRHIKKKLAH